MNSDIKSYEWAANLQLIADQMITHDDSNRYILNQAALLNRIAAELLVDTPNRELH